MFSKIFLILAAVCVVKASVIPDNFFDDVREIEVASDPKACSPQACRDACRRLGFPIGVCSGGRCFCRRAKAQDAYPLIDAAGDEREEANEILSNGEEILKKEPSYLEELISLKENDPESEVASDPKSCKTQACRNACRRLGFSNGFCLAKNCYCKR
ncbi:hypothetical protein PYW07_015788 [Mythimna separata]|uniref:Uncharacterized protein n=1 Tax=Mythimna separata TaxID=271217 RepID=A0AAD7YRE6_MYTSE|nr:hypothetical protein PYW07_015788 [Mythimna separata]